jgi:hypothetical protein
MGGEAARNIILDGADFEPAPHHIGLDIIPNQPASGLEKPVLPVIH